METVQTVLMVVQVLTAMTLIGFILIQQGKGADAGAAFGSGASATVFGARGSGNFLSRTTSVLATVFLINSLALAWIAKERMENASSVMETAITETAAPAETAPVQNAAADATTAPAPTVTESEVPAAPTPDSEVPTAPE
ncbi:MAG: preprotein translocase subunit SecG [Gammaproteobacteria bacterium RIFCSPLOWO2_02_FULL_61_13]|nr:MAG: preprotein translocase subunit SecG [Gammaproteobacteria bacterium RIFCSPLOWO2_02_FULL_61_13]